MRDAFYARTGVFVHIKSTWRRDRLQGCAGAYRGEDQLGHAIVDAAIKAALGGPYQTEIETPELSNLNISICIANNYILVNDPAADIELSTYGIAVDTGGTHDWIYPVLPVELGWPKGRLLTDAYRKASLSPLV